MAATFSCLRLEDHICSRLAQDTQCDLVSKRVVVQFQSPCTASLRPWFSPQQPHSADKLMESVQVALCLDPSPNPDSDSPQNGSSSPRDVQDHAYRVLKQPPKESSCGFLAPSPRLLSGEGRPSESGLLIKPGFLILNLAWFGLLQQRNLISGCGKL